MSLQSAKKNEWLNNAVYTENFAQVKHFIHLKTLDVNPCYYVKDLFNKKTPTNYLIMGVNSDAWIG